MSGQMKAPLDAARAGEQARDPQGPSSGSSSGFAFVERVIRGTAAMRMTRAVIHTYMVIRESYDQIVQTLHQ